jgi:hypothetical protein
MSDNDAVSRIVAAIIARADDVFANQNGFVTLSFHRAMNSQASTAELKEIVQHVRAALAPN